MSSAPRPTITNARQAERAVLSWMRGRGYVDAKPALEGPEGVDVAAFSGLAQVRFGDAAVRRSELQKLDAAREGRPDVALFAVTTSSFDLPAQTFADSKNIVLLHLTPDGRFEPLNSTARLLLGGPGAALGTPGTGGTPGIPLVPILKHVPLVGAAYFLVVAGIQAKALASGAEDAPTVTSVVLSALAGVGLVAVWYFGTRRLGRTRDTDQA